MPALIATLLLVATPTAAHGPAGAVAGGELWGTDPWIAIPLMASGLAFHLGALGLWRSAGFGRGLPIRRAAAFWAGWLALAAALLSPLHWLGDRLFAAHMVEHGLLMLVAAPLIAYARPSQTLSWSLPRLWRPRVGSLMTSPRVAAMWGRLRQPLSATLLQALALWIWHAPSLYTLALHDETAHRLEHLCFFFSALLFWWALFQGRRAWTGDRARDAAAVGCLFLTVLHSGVLGALLTISSRIWYPAQVAFSFEFGLAPLEDQQLAGVLMWIPMGALYTCAALWFSARLLRPRRSDRVARTAGNASR